MNSKKLIKVILAVIAGLVLVLCIAVVVYWGCIGVTTFDEGVASLKKLLTPGTDDTNDQKTYTVSDSRAREERNRVVATVGDQELNNSTLQVYYWMNVFHFLESYGDYAAYYGLDYTQPLDQQTHQESGGTWQQYFLEQALTNYHHYQAMALLALEEGVVTQAELDSKRSEFKESLEEATQEGGFADPDALLQAEMGAGCTADAYYDYFLTYYAGGAYYTEKSSQLEITWDQIEDWFAANETALQEQGITKDSGNLVDVRHILIAVEGGTEDEEGNVTYSAEEWETCRAEAQGILDQWLAGDATEESFAQLANEYSEDIGSNENGGLYEGKNAQSGFVSEFVDWYMDESRQVGDYGLVQTDYGYHVMYFSGSEPQWIRACREALVAEQSRKILDVATERYPIEVNDEEIALGNVDLI